jgi:hypothetical protein
MLDRLNNGCCILCQQPGLFLSTLSFLHASLQTWPVLSCCHLIHDTALCAVVMYHTCDWLPRDPTWDDVIKFG